MRYVAAYLANAGLAPLLCAICEVRGSGAMDRATGAVELHDALVRSTESRRSLLIVVEVKHLITADLEQLRALHDVSGAGLALIGSRDLYPRLLGKV